MFALRRTDFLQCRICGSEIISECGQQETDPNCRWLVYDCWDCGSRFTMQHDGAVYEQLYSDNLIYYQEYGRLWRVCRDLFKRGDRVGLRNELVKNSKYQFIIDEIDRWPIDARILELGCSTGFLGSYFILSGRPIIGVDVSPTAIGWAKAAFGDHFVLAGDSAVDAGAPYDVVYHVGTIGCVRDPVGFTWRCLELLRPGGSLLFNAPNRDAIRLPGQLWLDTAPPPDLVTLFSAEFWREQFGSAAVVCEQVEHCTPIENAAIALRRATYSLWRAVGWRMPEMKGRSVTAKMWGRLLRYFETAVCTCLAHSRWSRTLRAYPRDFGLFISMVRKSETRMQAAKP